MCFRGRWLFCVGLFCSWPMTLFGGGSGLNVMVVVNQTSTNSVQLGNYLCEKRQIPPQNLVRINWAGGIVDWTNSDFNTFLFTPLTNAIATRGLTNQIDYVVLSMDIPYRVYQYGGTSTYGVNSTTAATFYGFKTDFPASPAYSPSSCNLPSASSNSFAGSEGIFRATAPGTGSNSFLTTMITASNLALAELIVDQGVAGDFSFPTGTVYLAKSDDRLRNIRYQLFDNTIFDCRLRGNYSIQRTNVNNPADIAVLQGYQNGVQQFGAGSSWFLPGSLSD